MSRNFVHTFIKTPAKIRQKVILLHANKAFERIFYIKLEPLHFLLLHYCNYVLRLTTSTALASLTDVFTGFFVLYIL